MISMSSGTVIRGGTVIAGDAVSLSVISSSRDCSCSWVVCEDMRLLDRVTEGDRLRFRPRGTDVVVAVVDVVVVVVVVVDEEGSGSGS